MMKTLYKIVKPDLKHLKYMAKSYRPELKDQREFWMYTVSFALSEIERIERIDAATLAAREGEK